MRPPGFAVAVAVVFTVLTSPMPIAAAAGIGTLNAATLYGRDYVQPGKQVYGWEDFSTNANNIGATLDSGQAWVQQSGSWRRTGGAAFDNQNGAAHYVDANLGKVDADILVTFGGGVTVRNAGVEFNGGALGALVVKLQSQTTLAGATSDFVALYTLNAAGTALTTVATANIGSSAEANGVILRVAANGTSVNVYLDTALVRATNPSLSSASPAIPTYKAQTRYGLVSTNDKITTFDDFHVDSTYG
jgi:hypothetical protein